MAPTVAGLLGMPVPRHSQGRFVAALFDADTSRAAVDANAALAEAAQRSGMGPDLFRTLEHWQWKDLYYQQHALLAQFLSSPEVNARASLDALDSSDATRSQLLAASDDGSSAAYRMLIDSLDALFRQQRDDTSLHLSANWFVAAFILGCIMLLIIFAMQLRNFCDPLIVLLPQGQRDSTTPGGHPRLPSRRRIRTSPSCSS